MSRIAALVPMIAIILAGCATVAVGPGDEVQTSHVILNADRGYVKAVSVARHREGGTTWAVVAINMGRTGSLIGAFERGLMEKRAGQAALAELARVRHAYPNGTVGVPPPALFHRCEQLAGLVLAVMRSDPNPSGAVWLDIGSMADNIIAATAFPRRAEAARQACYRSRNEDPSAPVVWTTRSFGPATTAAAPVEPGALLVGGLGEALSMHDPGAR